MAELKTRPRKTIDDFRSLPDETRAELIEGEITMTPTPVVRHQRIVGNLFVELRGVPGGGQALLSPLDVYLPSGDIVEPDVLWISPERLHIVGKWIQGAPDLAIEVLSPGSLDRDRFVKKQLYARNGIREYWIVDPEERTVEVFSLAGDRYEPAGYFVGESSVKSQVLPGLAAPLARIFA